MRYVLGIDAGGTKTVGLLAEETGRVVAEARGTGANLQTHGELEVEKVFDGILEELGSRGKIGILRRLGYRETARVVNDAAIALVAGASERAGIVILAGTGSIAYGADRAGNTARSGGYGFLLADEGSGYWLGHQALRAAVRSADGRGPRSLLADLVFESLGVGSVAEMVPVVYEKGLPKFRIAAHAGLVQKASDRGDAVATALLEEAALELSLAARAVAARLSLGEGPYRVVLAGGVFKACPTLPARIEACLRLPGAELVPLRVEPAQGAVTLALDLLRS